MNSQNYARHKGEDPPKVWLELEFDFHLSLVISNAALQDPTILIDSDAQDNFQEAKKSSIT